MNGVQTAVPLEEYFDNGNPNEVLKEIMEKNPDAPLGKLKAMFFARARRNDYLFMKLVEADFDRRYKTLNTTKKPRATKAERQSELERALQQVQERLPGLIGERTTLYGKPVANSPREELVESGTFQVRLGRHLEPGQTPEQAGFAEAKLSRVMAATFLTTQKT